LRKENLSDEQTLHYGGKKYGQEVNEEKDGEENKERTQ